MGAVAEESAAAVGKNATTAGGGRSDNVVAGRDGNIGV